MECSHERIHFRSDYLDGCHTTLCIRTLGRCVTNSHNNDHNLKPGSDDLPTRSKQITCVGYTCLSCSRRVAVLRSTIPQPDASDPFLKSKCSCGLTRWILDEEIQSLEIWTEFPADHTAVVLPFRTEE